MTCGVNKTDICETISKNSPPVLYHYTTQKGLLGIVNSSSIWASHSAFLNDAKEYTYGFEMLLERAKDHRLIYENILRYMPDVYVCSFSAKGDMLSQWRAYASNANGISIGFRTVGLHNLANVQRFKLVPCIYDPALQLDLLNRKLEIYRDMIKAISSTHSMNQLVNDFYETALMIKNPYFFEEQEWRLISELDSASPLENLSNNNLLSFPERKIKVREGNFSLIPYIDFDLKYDQYDTPPIEEIIIGPGLYPDSSRALSLLLVSNGYSGQITIPGMGIRHSQIPYRV